MQIIIETMDGKERIYDKDTFLGSKIEGPFIIVSYTKSSLNPFECVDLYPIANVRRLVHDEIKPVSAPLASR